jgi:hypothetical protein
MYCPQCGVESSDGLQYCRSCGANLKVIGKALSLSEAIARSDRGPMPKIKEMMKNLKVDQVTDEISKALDHMNKEIVKHNPPPTQPSKPWWQKDKKTPRERREEKITKGIISFFSGIGLTVFLYFLSAALVLKLPPDVVAKIPFEVEPVVHMIWLIGLISTMSGLGSIIAGLLIRTRPEEARALRERNTVQHRLEERIPAEPLSNVREFVPARQPFEEERRGEVASVTERTTNLLEVRSGRVTGRTDEER